MTVSVSGINCSLGAAREAFLLFLGKHIFIRLVFFGIPPQSIDNFSDAKDQVRHIKPERVVRDVVSNQTNLAITPAEGDVSNQKRPEICLCNDSLQEKWRSETEQVG
jgi:hypothetical protein